MHGDIPCHRKPCAVSYEICDGTMNGWTQCMSSQVVNCLILGHSKLFISCYCWKVYSYHQVF